MKKIKWGFHLLPKCDVCAKFELCRLLGGPARECDATPHRQTEARTDRRTPGEYSANSGPAGLMPGPELSNSQPPSLPLKCKNILPPS